MIVDRAVPDRLLRAPEACKLTGLSRTTLWRLSRSGMFPAPVQLSSPAAVGWSEREINAWIAARVENRDAQIKRKASKV